MSINFDAAVDEPMWDEPFDYDDDVFSVSASDDFLDIPMEVDCAAHENLSHEDDRDLLAVDWDLTDEIHCPILSPRTIVSNNSSSSSPSFTESPRPRSPSPILPMSRMPIIPSLLFSSSSDPATSTFVGLPQRTPPTRTVSDHSSYRRPAPPSRTTSSSSLEWQLQQNAKRFTDLMRRSDQTRSIVRQCRPSASDDNCHQPSASGGVRRADSWSEDEDGFYMPEQQRSVVTTPPTDDRHANFFESEQCREQERSRRQLYKLLSQNYM